MQSFDGLDCLVRQDEALRGFVEVTASTLIRPGFPISGFHGQRRRNDT